MQGPNQDNTRKINNPGDLNGPGETKDPRALNKRDGLCFTCGKVFSVDCNQTISPDGPQFCPKDEQPLVILPQMDEPLVGHYLYKGLLGMGGMGLVFKALNPYLDKKVAIKTLKGKRYSEHELLRFQQEGKLLAKMVHPNLVTVLDFGVNKYQEPYMVLEYLRGESLAELIRQYGVIDLETTLDIARQTAAGLTQAHTFGAVHRDIKPGNIFICSNRDELQVKILDFGIAKMFFMDDPGARADLTKTGEIFGSPLYMSPEQALGKALDERSDIYSLGCVLYEMLTAKQPIKGESAMETIFKHISDEPKPLSQARPDKKYPQSVQDLLDLMLTKSRDERIQSAVELEEILTAIVNKDQKGLAALSKRAVALRKLHGKEAGAKDFGTVSTWEQNKFRNIALGLVCASIVTGGALGGLIFFTKQPERKTPVVAKKPEVITQTEITGSASSESTVLDQMLNPDEQTMKNLIQGELKKGKSTFKLPQGTVTPESMQIIADGSGNLKELEFSMVRGMTPAAISKLENVPVAKVHLQWGDLSDDGLEAAMKIKTLRVLELKGCRDVTAKAFAKLTVAKNLTNLVLEDQLVDGNYFGALPADTMTRISIFGKRYINSTNKPSATHADLLLKKISKLKELRNLDLEASDMTDEGLKAIGGLKHMEILSLDANENISDASFATLSQFKHLKTLRLDRTKVTPEGLEQFMKSSPVESVIVGNRGKFGHLTSYLKSQSVSGRLKQE